MTTVQDVLNALETIAPVSGAFSWDKIGLQVGSRSQPVSRAVVSLDRSLDAVRFAIDCDAQFLLTHHPLLFDPLIAVTDSTTEGKTVLELIRAGISFAAAHTNWDVADGGINDALAAKLCLENIRPFGSFAPHEELKLVFFCPPEATDSIIDACSSAGAGIIGAYSRCSFQSVGKGSFYGGTETNPTIGQAGTLETVEEVRVEMVCPSPLQSRVQKSLLNAHPYEEPAYDFIRLASQSGMPGGRIGELKTPLSLDAFAAYVDGVLGTRCWTWGKPDRRISTVAVVGGAAEGEFLAARDAGADAYITGEVRQHVALEAYEQSIPIIAAGHFATEHPGCVQLSERLKALLPEIKWTVFEPLPGQAGRPL